MKVNQPVSCSSLKSRHRPDQHSMRCGSSYVARPNQNLVTVSGWDLASLDLAQSFKSCSFDFKDADQAPYRRRLSTPIPNGLASLSFACGRPSSKMLARAALRSAPIRAIARQTVPRTATVSVDSCCLLIVLRYTAKGSHIAELSSQLSFSDHPRRLRPKPPAPHST